MSIYLIFHSTIEIPRKIFNMHNVIIFNISIYIKSDEFQFHHNANTEFICKALNLILKIFFLQLIFIMNKTDKIPISFGQQTATFSFLLIASNENKKETFLCIAFCWQINFTFSMHKTHLLFAL